MRPLDVKNIGRPAEQQQRQRHERPAAAGAVAKGGQCGADNSPTSAPRPPRPGPTDPPAPARIPTASFEVRYSDLVLGKTLGVGAFGRVVAGQWRGTQVAVKLIQVVDDEAGADHARSFLAPGGGPMTAAEVADELRMEVGVLSALRHPNIVLFMGASTTPPHLAIVTEQCRGSVWDLIHDRRREDLIRIANGDAVPSLVGMSGGGGGCGGRVSWRRCTQMALDTARGMAYLHSFSPPLLHRDLKSANLLLDDAGRIKLSDFGLSRLRAGAGEATMTSSAGTTHWMAPEVLSGSRYTEKADVYSFAVVLWELLTGKCPYSGMQAGQIAIAVVSQGSRPSQVAVPADAPVALGQVMRDCWQQEPKRRPGFMELVPRLEACLAALEP